MVFEKQKTEFSWFELEFSFFISVGGSGKLKEQSLEYWVNSREIIIMSWEKIDK